MDTEQLTVENPSEAQSADPVMDKGLEGIKVNGKPYAEVLADEKAKASETKDKPEQSKSGDLDKPREDKGKPEKLYKNKAEQEAARHTRQRERLKTELERERSQRLELQQRLEAVERSTGLVKDEQIQERRNAEQYETIKTEWQDKVADCYEDEEGLRKYGNAVQSLASRYNGGLDEALPQDALDYIARRHDGPKILQYIGEHGDLNEHIKKMHPIDRADAMRKIAAYLSAPKEVATQGRQPQTQAQPQARPIGRVGVGVPSKPTAELSIAEQLEIARKKGW